MEAFAAALFALATAIFTATRMKRDFDRDYIEDLEKRHKDAEEDRDAWKRRALMAEQELRDRYRGRG